MNPYAWLVKKAGKIGAQILLALLVILLIVGGYFAVKNYFQGDLKTEIKVSKGQTGAAMDSGHAAVETIGNTQAREAAGASNVEETQREINNATDPAGITDAGLAGLHRVRGQASPNPRR